MSRTDELLPRAPGRQTLRAGDARWATRTNDASAAMAGREPLSLRVLEQYGVLALKEVLLRMVFAHSASDADTHPADAPGRRDARTPADGDASTNLGARALAHDAIGGAASDQATDGAG